jgi:hypothetical protein
MQLDMMRIAVMATVSLTSGKLDLAKHIVERKVGHFPGKVRRPLRRRLERPFEEKAARREDHAREEQRAF